MEHQVQVWAHRGASGYAPENTLEAFKLAVSQGAHAIELDVHLSKDGELVVAHDESVDRVSNGTGLIQNMTLAQLKELDFSRTHPEYSPARIPTLRQVYELIKPTLLNINVEVKTNWIRYEGIEEKLIALAKEMGMENRVLYSSFYHNSLIKLRELDPGVKIGLLYQDGFLDVPKYAKGLGADALHPDAHLLDVPGFLEECRQYGLLVHPWTINKEKDLIKMVGMGVDAVITNYPDRALKICGRKQNFR